MSGQVDWGDARDIVADGIPNVDQRRARNVGPDEAFIIILIIQQPDLVFYMLLLTESLNGSYLMILLKIMVLDQYI